MGRVVVTPPAVADLDKIFDRIAGNDAGAAFRFLAAVDRKAELYAGNPALSEERTDLAPGLRSFVVGRYVAVYRAIPAGIEVLRVLHGARDMSRLFRGK